MLQDLNNLGVSWTYALQLNDYLDEWDSIPIMHFSVEPKRALSDDLHNEITNLEQRVKVSNIFFSNIYFVKFFIIQS